jgi:hypothetical protein
MPSESPSQSSAPSKSGKASKASQKSPTVSKAPKSTKSLKSVELAFNVGGKVLRIQNGGGNTVVLKDCSDFTVTCDSWQQYGKYLKDGDYYLTIDVNDNLALDPYAPTEWKIKDEEKCKILYTQPEGGLRNVVCANNSGALELVKWEYREEDSPITGSNCCLEDGISSIE